MRYPTSKRSSKGFSLTEILITLIVVGVGIAVVVRFQGISAREGQVAKQRAQAATLLEQKMEELRADPVTAATTNSGAGEDVVNLESMQFDRFWQVSENPKVKGEYLINASAEWADLGYSARQNSLKPLSDEDVTSKDKVTGPPAHAMVNHIHPDKTLTLWQSKSTKNGFVSPNSRLATQAVVHVTTRQMTKGINLPCQGTVTAKSKRMKMGESEEDRQWEDSMGMHDGKYDSKGGGGGCAATTVRKHGMMRMHE